MDSQTPQSGEDEFVRERAGRADIAVRRDFREALTRLGLHDPAFTPPASAARYHGRARVYSLEVSEGPVFRAVVRHYRHGGVSGLLFGGWFLGRSRALKEVELARAALRAGVPSFKPLAAVTFRTLGLFYRALLVSEEVEGAKDLAALVEETGGGDASALRRASRCAARAVRGMHDAGFFHGDLNMKNILVTEGETPEACILDWDLARSSPPPLSRRGRLLNLMRLDRSARKFTSRGIRIPWKERLRFLKHYFAAGGVTAPTRSELRRWALHSKIHAVAWFFSR